MAHNDGDIGTDFNISEMQRSAISCFFITDGSFLILFDFFSINSSEYFPIDGSTSPGGCLPPADEAGIAENGLNQAALEFQRIDEFGRNASQGGWTRLHKLVEEYDSDGDLMPDGDLRLRS